MSSALFLMWAGAHLALLVWMLRTDDLRRPATVIVATVVGALVYDNTVLGLGATIGEGDLLELLSWPRFIFHALFTPTLMIAAARLVSRSEAVDGNVVPVPRWVAPFTLALITLGVVTHLVGADFVAVETSGVIRYTEAKSLDPDVSPLAVIPIASILTVIVVGVFGARLRRSLGSPILLVASVAMFLLSAAPQGDPPILGNVAEVLFLGLFVLTLRRVAIRERALDAAPEAVTADPLVGA